MSDPDMSDDPEAAMREMMGFNNFGGTKRPKELHQDRKPSPLTGANATSKIPVPVAKRVKTSSDHQSSHTTSASSQNPSLRSATNLVPASVLPYTPRTSSSTSQPPAPSTSDQGLDQEPNTITSDGTFATTTATHTLPPRPLSGVDLPPEFSDQQHASMQTESAQIANNADATTTEIKYAYTSPTNPSITFTKQQLDELARGTGPKNSQGDTIYFKPGFVVDDPWERVRKLHEQRRGTDNRGGEMRVT